MIKKHVLRKFLIGITITTAIIGALPLIYLGLITPHVLTAELAGGGDIAFAAIISLQSFTAGIERDSTE